MPHLVPHWHVRGIVQKIVRHLGIRKNVMAGLFVWLAIIITYFILKFGFNAMDEIFKPLLPFIPKVSEHPTGVSAVMVIIILYLTGWISALAFGKKVTSFIKEFPYRIPIVKEVYALVHPATESIRPMTEGEEEEEKKKGKVVVVPWAGAQTMGLLMSVVEVEDTDMRGIMASQGPQGIVYVPTPPNPANGFLIFLPIDDIKDMEVTVDKAGKTRGSLMTQADYIAAVVSMGSIFPQKIRTKK